MKTVITVVIALLLANGARADQPPPGSPIRIAVDGAELHYVEQGKGETVILLHGGQADYRSWQALTTALAPKYRVIAYSRRYHYPNRNAIAPDHSAIVDARDLFALVTQLGVGRVHLVGASYGAFAALAFAIDHPEMVSSLVLAEPPVHQWVTHTPQGLALYQDFFTRVHNPAAKFFAAGDDAAAMRVYIDAFEAPGTFDRMPAERRTDVMANASFFKALSRSADPFPNLPKDRARRLSMPVLLVRGANTDALHTAVLEEVARIIPNAKRAVIPDAGHGSPRQNPQAFNAAVMDFLGAATPAASAAGRNVLFIGNSFLFGSGSAVRFYRADTVTDLNNEGIGGVPALFKSFTQQAGLDYEVALETRGGSGLDFHLGEKLGVIGSRPWGTVVMHGFSLLDAQKPRDPAKLVATSKQMADFLRGKNPNVELFLISTWARADNVYPAKGAWTGQTVEVMTKDVRAAYDQAAKAAAVKGVIPVGESWLRAMQSGIADPNPYDGIEAGKLNLWTYDSYHASTHGYYLQALIIFGTLTGRDPRSLGDGECSAYELGMSRAETRALQQVAFDQIAGAIATAAPPKETQKPAAPVRCVAAK